MAQVAVPPSCLRDRLASGLDAAASRDDEVAAGILRLVLAAIRDRDTAARAEDRCSGCDDEEIVAILRQMSAQREASSRSYDASGRPDMADREREEIGVLARFLPPLMDDESMRAAARSVVEELEAGCLRDMGRCIQTLKTRYPGQMDFVKAGAEVRDLLS